MTGWQLYWLFKLDTFQLFFGFAGFLIIVGGVVGAITAYTHDENYWHSAKPSIYSLRKHVKSIALSTAIFGSLFVLTAIAIPDTKTMAAIYVIPKIVKDGDIESVGQDAKDIYKLGIERLKDLLEEPKSTNQ